MLILCRCLWPWLNPGSFSVVQSHIIADLEALNWSFAEQYLVPPLRFRTQALLDSGIRSC